MTDRRVTLDNLGAWLIKGNADRAELVDRFAREPTVTRWCVRPSYRTALMAPGQPVVFWASGSRLRRGYGVWGIGRLIDPPLPDGAGGLAVPLELTIWPPDRRVDRARLRADGRLAGIEVFRQPQGSNPSFLTRAEFAALQEHC